MFGGGSASQNVIAAQPQSYGGLRFTSSCFGAPLPIVWGQMRIGPNVIWYGDFTTLAINQGGGGGGGGGKGGGGPIGGGGKGGSAGSGTVSYQYYAAVQMSLCYGPIDGIGVVWVNKNQSDLATLGMTAFLGSSSQSAWSYLTSNHPGQDLAYRNEAHIDVSGYRLTDTAELPQHTFEVKGLKRYNAGGGIVDANPADIVPDFLSNAIYGVGFASSQVANLATGNASFSNWCVASGLFLSPGLDSQQQARKLVDEIAQVTNSDAAWIDAGNGTAQFNMLPRGDVTVTGNSVTFTPNMSPQYTLTDDDFVPPKDGEPPVRCTRTAPADAYNDVLVEFFGRTNQYNPVIAEAKDLTAIDQFMTRVMPVVSAHSIALQSAAQLAAHMILYRALYVRNQYAFSTSLKFARVEPGDLLGLTDSGLGLNNQLVRVTKVEYGPPAGQLISFTTEEVPSGTGAAPIYASQTGNGSQTDYNIDPGLSSTPFVFDAPGFLTVSGFEIWLAVAGGANWGGAEVWISTDNATFARAGKTSGKARYGTLTANFPSHVDPDTVDTLSVDLTISQGQLLSGAQADADLYNTLCIVGADGELVSYQTATLTAAYKYDLKNYLRRGAYNTVPAAALTGASFARLDNAIFKLEYDPAMVGKTVWFKLLPFNIYGSHLYQLSQVTSIPFTIGGPIGAPANVTGFSASQNGNVVVFQWNLLPQNNISGYEIRYNPLTVADPSNWGNATPLTQVTKGTQITTAKLPPGNWTCLIKAVDTSQKYSLAPASFTINVTNQNVMISQQKNEPDWMGQRNGVVATPAGLLVLESSVGASALTNAQLFTQFVPSPVVMGTYTAAEVDLGFVGTVRITLAENSALGQGVSTGVANPTTMLETRTSLAQQQNYQPWTIGTASCRYFGGRLQMASTIGDMYATLFEPTVDAPATPTTVNGQVIAPGGTTITFASQYHLVPNVQATMAAGALNLTPVVTNVTKTTCVINVFDATNTSVGGTVNLTITGV